jgi:secreted PhoX family phosphatase
MTVDRRNFLRASMKYTGGALLAPSLAGLAACSKDMTSPAGAAVLKRAKKGAGGYGPLYQSADCPELLIPREFRVVRLSVAGQPMKSGGGLVPNALDGMAAFPLPNGNIRLIRNHELRDSAAVTTAIGNPALAYDQKGGGGTTSLEVAMRADGTPNVIREFVSLGGTLVNCAGGATVFHSGSWITCEETTEGPSGGRLQPHGYCFDVPVDAESQVAAVPIKAMGRFVHEALAMDPHTGWVYLTEDGRYDAANPSAQPGSGFFRFIPNTRGALTSGGRLQMLAVVDRPRYDTTRGQDPFVRLGVEWVDIADPDPAAAEIDPYAVMRQGLALGAAFFQRLEGCWWGDHGVYFNSTSGGDEGMGQIWHYRPHGPMRGELVMIFESPGSDVLESPDNLCVSPRGGLVLCEDGNDDQFMRGLTTRGEIFDLVQAPSLTASEFAGACFSPDGETLFFNSQGSTSAFSSSKGVTYAMRGPWGDGAL